MASNNDDTVSKRLRLNNGLRASRSVEAGAKNNTKSLDKKESVLVQGNFVASLSSNVQGMIKKQRGRNPQRKFAPNRTVYAPKLSDYLADGGVLKYRPRPEWYMSTLQGRRKRRREEAEADMHQGGEEARVSRRRLALPAANNANELLPDDASHLPQNQIPGVFEADSAGTGQPPAPSDSSSDSETSVDGRPTTFGKDHDSALHVAIRASAVEASSELIELGAPVSAINVKKVTPLILASQKGHLSIVKKLLQRGVDPLMTSVSGSNALLQACHFGHTGVVKLLILKGAIIEMANFKNTTPLMRASQEGHTDVVRLLIEEGANVNRRNNEQMSALMLASQRGHADIVQMLIDSHADINAMTAQKSTSLLLACKREHISVVKVLVKSGCELFYKDTRGRTARDIAVRKESPILLRLLNPSKQVELMQRKARVDRNHNMKLVWTLLQNERAFVQLSANEDTSIHNLPVATSPLFMGLGSSQLALIRTMALPEPLLENIASFMPLPNLWEDRLRLMTRRSSVDADAAIATALDLMDEVLEAGGFLDACDKAGIKAPAHFKNWEEWRSWGHRHNNLDPKLPKSSRRNALTSTLPGLPTSALNHKKEELLALKPECSIEMRRGICFLQLLAHRSPRLSQILCMAPFCMPPWIIDQVGLLPV